MPAKIAHKISFSLHPVEVKRINYIVRFLADKINERHKHIDGAQPDPTPPVVGVAMKVGYPP